MLYRSTFRSKLGTACLLSFLMMVSLASARLKPDKIDDPKARIKVIYPKPGQIVAAVDSMFILGNVPAANDNLAYRLFVNNRFVPVHDDGGFIAFVPITTGDFEFRFEAYLVDKALFADLGPHDSTTVIPPTYIKRTLTESLKVSAPLPLPQLRFDTTLFDREINAPSGSLALSAGERMTVSFRGTPMRAAWFSIPGMVDSVPMAEDSPLEQPYWGEAVFGAGAVPDSLKLDGIYTGFFDIPASARCDTAKIKYSLGPLPHCELYDRAIRRNFTVVTPLYYYTLLEPYGWDDTVRIDTVSSYTVTLNSPEYPFTVQFKDSIQVMRHGPLKGYFSIFQPKGVRALAVGAEGDWYRLRLSKTQIAWVNTQSVEKLSFGIVPPSSFISSIRAYDFKDYLLLEFPLKGNHPFRIFEDDRRTLRIQLFGVTSNIDWIRYDFNSHLIDLATWSQPEEGLWELKLALTKDIWGYDSYYKGNTFFLRLNKPPDNVDHFEGKRIAIDAGHSSDPGAIGPTGYTEAEANLAIALAVKEDLMKKGATVIMTRSDTSHVPLQERPAIANTTGADLFISIHNNALPDGVNPFENNGTSIYYYHPHSLNLARAIHTEMLHEIKLPDFGLYHGNLHVNRPTQYPAVLVECAFMILPEHEALLKTDKFREKIAHAITKGIETFLKGYKDANQ